MKKIFNTIGIIILMASLNAQSLDVGQKRKMQYYHSIEINGGYSLLDGYDEFIKYDNKDIMAPFNKIWSVGIRELQGIQFNPHLSLALELGLDFRKGYADGPNFRRIYPWIAVPYPNIYFLDFSLGLNLKYTVLKNYRWSPLLMMDFSPLGISARGLQSSFHEDRDWSYRMGWNISAGVQYRFRDRQSVYAALGYEVVWSQLNLTIGVRLR